MNNLNNWRIKCAKKKESEKCNKRIGDTKNESKRVSTQEAICSLHIILLLRFGHQQHSRLSLPW